MVAEIQIPAIMKIGAGAFSEVGSVLLRLHCARPLIVTDPFLVSCGLAERLRDQIVRAGIPCAVFYETVPDPTTDAVDGGVRAYLAGGHDSLVSLGGGSSIDTAKAIGLLVANGGRAGDYKVPNQIPRVSPPHIAVPTTAGTGSEVTRFAVISDSISQEKMLIAGGYLLPSAAIVDYELSISMPQRLTADTGTDSLTHAIEAYVSRKANPFTDTFALSAMKTIWVELPVAFRQPENRAAREAMMLAATLAGIAFSNASVALVHGMSRPIGVFFHVPHGLSNAMLLPTVTEFSAGAAPGRYADCARAMGIAAQDDAEPVAVSKLVEGLFRRNEELEVPSPKSYGISEDRYFEVIPTMAAQALASGSPQNNPRIPSAQEIEQLYREIWK
ncbi:MAG: iron-containing alcohol dehydrogenase [Terracidiphilus sp.]|jgi:alcohol dehydrogenase class IV